MATTDDPDSIFAIIGNIPHDYHSSDLRNFFSQFIETDGFTCFHYRHRPETKIPTNGTIDDCPQASTCSSTAITKTHCCIVRVKENRISELLNSYHRKHWLDRKEESLPTCCMVSKIRVANDTDSVAQKYKTRGEQKKRNHEGEQMSLEDLKKLPELNPPANVMPQGNVGTPTKVFLELIRACKLPPALIGKLGLTFPKNRAKRRYGDVPFDYKGEVHPGHEETDTAVFSADGRELEVENEDIIAGRIKQNRKVEEEERQSNEEEKSEPESEVDVDDCEEWERHEALHDDPANIERNKERVYEEEMEIVWEKGGPGIVWYTDAQYWRQHEGDFDEQTTDDWDVDMSVYYDPTGGDKDARDFVTLRRDERRRKGFADAEEDMHEGVGKFEKHTKGIGRRVLEKQGWKEGAGLGRSVRGMAEAIDAEGQKPRDKTGFGYRGEKLQRVGLPRKRKAGPGIITTVYDNPAETDPSEPLMRRLEPYHLKYRPGAMRFHKGADATGETQK